MANFKSGIQRNQLLTTYLDELISPDNHARVIDAFVDSLDLSSFKYSSPSSRGNRPYNPSDLLKLFLLGYKQGIRSSRKLMYNAQNNIEFIWLLKGLKPDHRTISDFRKDNISLLKDIFFKFNLSCKDLKILSNFVSQDGTKLKAVNSKDKNFTFSKIDDRKKHILDHIDNYLTLYDLTDQVEDKEELLSKIDSLSKRLNTLDSYEQNMIKNNKTQKSLTDPDSKLMKDNGKFTVAYNNQVCVDVDSHIVSNFNISTNPSDLGSILDVSNELKNVYNFDTIHNVTDKGYNDRNDMIASLENGIIPHVTPSKDKSSFTLETTFEESSISTKDIKSTNPKTIKKCLKAGVIPDVYKDCISSVSVKDVNTYKSSSDDVNNSTTSLSEDELRDIAISEHCFSRHIPSDKVFCPMGEILRKKSKFNNGIRYANKLACKNCKNPCTTSPFKTVDFKHNKVFVARKKNKNTKQKKTKKVVKKVFFEFIPDTFLLKKRMATSEHPHASMKFWDNSNYLLLKGLDKVTGEVSLYYCAYNIRRAINILGAQTLIDYFKHGILPNYVNNDSIFSNKTYFIFSNKTYFFTILKDFLFFFKKIFFYFSFY